MPLSVGDSLGPYKILAPIGAGGMGEVYRARDTKLKRDVAVKILPEAFARDPGRMLRFQREAEVLASLNHPNIATIYGVEDRALVMELVEGESPKGPLPFEDAWKVARQIAEALEYAHEKGIVHRDLKPANVKVTPEGVVKLLDFGLAKAFTGTPDASASDPENSPTVTLGATVAGTIMGTAAYMAPEQAKGKKVDKRADIWSWGVVLYELLTGDPLFKGDDAADTLAQVLTREPDLERVPPKVRRLLRRCLEKDPKKRLRDIGVAGDLLEENAAAAPQPHLRWAWGAAAGVLILGLAGTGWGWWRAARSVERPPMRFNVDLGPEAAPELRVAAVLSPDGTRIVFPIRSNGHIQLATRLLDQANATPIPGTEDGLNPFFSPDGQWIGFFNSSGRLMKIPARGGGVVSLCDCVHDYGGSWGEDGNIVVGGAPRLMRVSSAGGAPEPLMESSAGQADSAQVRPQILPGGKAVLFTGFTSGGERNIEILSLKTAQKKMLIPGAYDALYLPTSKETGHVVYLQQGGMYGVAFNPDRLEFRGKPAPLLDDIAGSRGGPSFMPMRFDASNSGIMVYLRRQAGDSSYLISSLDSAGNTTALVAQPGIYDSPRFSPDGKRLAYNVTTNRGADVWVYDLALKQSRQLTFTSPGNRELVWAPDNQHLVFSSGQALWWARADGAAPAQALLEIKGANLRPQSISPDGRHLAFAQDHDGRGLAIWTVPLDTSDSEHPKPGKPEPFLSSPKFVDVDAAFSPDGRWIAYSSNESGQAEVYVRSFPGPGGKWKISMAGGKFPAWSRTAHQLFFLGGNDRIIAMNYTSQGDGFIPGAPKEWSRTPVRRTAALQNFDLAPDGKHVVMFQSPDSNAAGPPEVTFILNFFDYVRRVAPPGN